MRTHDADFDAHLGREMVESERLRTAILAVLFALIALLVALFTWAFRDSEFPFLRSPETLRRILAVMGGLIAYELFVRAMLGRMLRNDRSPPPAIRYLNALIETSVPTFLVLVLSREFDPAGVLQGPVVYLYAVFIILSTLRLDFWLSTFTGLVAAIGYGGLSFHYSGQIVGSAYANMLAPNFTLAKSIMLLLSGVVAGLVALQLRRRIARVFRAVRERERVLSAFGQQVSPAVAEELLRQGGELTSRRSFVCVMFMDIRDFTRQVEHLGPEEIVAFQNRVFGLAAEVVNRHHGMINQFLGDGFMATFGAPLSAGNDCANALAAARELVARAGTRIGIGLHAGDAVTGNIGSDERKQYSVTGNVVILAARLEQLNKEYGSQILVSREVLQHAGAAGQDAVSLGAVRVKGRDEPVEVHRLA
jgi:adenylate cyclase